MANLRNEAKASCAAKMHRMLGGAVSVPARASGGAVTAASAAPKRAAGGAVDGKKSAPRMDRARGGRVAKGKTVVNVMVAPQAPQMGGGVAPAMPPPAPPPVAAGGALPPPSPMGGGGPPMMPGMKRGGAVRAYSKGGTVTDAGAGSGVGRLEKIGKKA